VDLTPPFVLSVPPECTFHRTLDDAVAAARPGDGEWYDAHGVRFTVSDDGVAVASVEPDELAHLLRRWLGHVDAVRESTQFWPLWLLVHAAVDHAGYAP
jgi:hypothetical protein